VRVGNERDAAITVVRVEVTQQGAVDLPGDV
jgi:hypothetical protein